MERADTSSLVLPARANPGWRMRAGRLAARFVPMLLAAWIGLAGAAALAADAIVLSVAGTATAEGAPAAPGPRILQNGSELFEGDLVRTGDDGRVQFRFTDGGLVSLQPGTEFRIDEYRHGGASQRSFFSLLRGALRTATGAIGRRDHADYRLRTPTATVGIRGTEFLAEETVCDPRCTPGPTAGLRVSVTQGRIALSTGAGSIEVGQGQSAVVDGPNALPRLSAAGPVLAPRALASAAQSPGRGGTDGGSPAGSATAALPKSAAGATDTAAAAGEQAADPRFRLAQPGQAQPITVALGSTTSGLPAAPPPVGDAISPNNERGPEGELSAVSEALSKDGEPGSGDPGPGDPGPGDYGPGDPDPGDPGPGDPGPGDPDPGDPGPGDPGPGGPGPGDPGPGDPDPGDPDPGDPDPGDPGPGDPGPGDPDPGDPGPGDPDPGDPGPGDPDPGDPGPGDPGTPPPLSGPGIIGTDGRVFLRNLPPVLGIFDWLPLTGIGGRYVLDEQGLLQSVGVDTLGGCLLSICLSRGSTRVAEAGADAWSSWGRWTGGTIGVHGLLGFSVLPGDRRLSENQGLHYLVGVPSTTVPTSGVFSYGLLGATQPTLTDGSAAPGSFSGSAAVAFAPGQIHIGLDGLVTIGGRSYGFHTRAGTANPAQSTLTTNAAAGFTFSGRSANLGSGPLNCTGGCTVGVSGGLFGPEAARLGLSYEIEPNRGSTISGVGVFQKQ